MIDTLDPESIYETSVPGLVIWQYRRQTHTEPGTGRKFRSRFYSVIHEPSGAALLPGTSGHIKVAPKLAMALDAVTALGDIPIGRGTVDWTLPFDELEKIQRVRWACMAVAGWVTLTGNRDKALRAWADRHGVKLTWDDVDEIGGVRRRAS